MGQCFQQTRAEAGIVCAQHVRFGHGCRADAPIARRRVVHGVGKSSRRYLAAGERQRLAEFVTVLSVAAGRGEHAGEPCGVLAGLRGGLQRNRHRQFDDAAGAPAFRGRQNRRHRQNGGRGPVGLNPRQHGGGRGPIAEAWPEKSEAIEVRREFIPRARNEAAVRSAETE